jgi:hypothetical protein
MEIRVGKKEGMRAHKTVGRYAVEDVPRMEGGGRWRGQQRGDKTTRG